MKYLFGLISMSLVIFGCINENVLFKGTTTISDDGRIARQGQIAITLSGERTVANDSIAALEFFNSNFVSPDSGKYVFEQSMSDSTLLIQWNAEFQANTEIVSDYIHIGPDSSKASNSISLHEKDKWFFKDYSYTEIYSDPIDTSKVFSIINDSFSSATQTLLDEKAIKSIGDSINVHRILNRAQEIAGIGLYKLFLQKPDSTEYLLHYLEGQLHDLADSVARFSGNQAYFGIIDSLMLYYYGASAEGVWDKISPNSIGLFGSYGIDSGSKNKFSIEMAFPGWLLKSNADEVTGNICQWQFDNRSFLGKEKRLEATFRIWSLPKSFAGLIIFLIAGYLALKPGTKKKTTPDNT